jgi:hypothetical protein
MNHVPTAVGIVLCERVLVDESTQNVTPVECFNLRLLVISTIPGDSGFFALAWLADGEGEFSAEIIIRRLDNGEEIYRFEKTLAFKDRMDDARFLARVRGCTFPVAGYYEFVLVIGGELIASRRFRIQKG